MIKKALLLVTIKIFTEIMRSIITDLKIPQEKEIMVWCDCITAIERQIDSIKKLMPVLKMEKGEVLEKQVKNIIIKQCADIANYAMILYRMV